MVDHPRSGRIQFRDDLMGEVQFHHQEKNIEDKNILIKSSSIFMLIHSISLCIKSCQSRLSHSSVKYLVRTDRPKYAMLEKMLIC
jgi:hypothetical protein